MATKRITVESIGSHFESRPDPRHTQNRKHLFIDIVVTAVRGLVCGCGGPTAIRRRAADRADRLSEFLELPDGIPSRGCIRNLLTALRPEAFRACFRDWIAGVMAIDDGAPARLVATDGKTLRRPYDRAHGLGPLPLVRAWARGRGIAMGRVATEEGPNEITPIPQPLKQIELHKTSTTIDAMGCHKDIARDTVAGGGDFVIAVRDNQPKPSEAIGGPVGRHRAGELEALKHPRYQAQERGHGQLDERFYSVAQVPSDFAASGRGSRPSARPCGSPRTPTGARVARRVLRGEPVSERPTVR